LAQLCQREGNGLAGALMARSLLFHSNFFQFLLLQSRRQARQLALDFFFLGVDLLHLPELFQQARLGRGQILAVPGQFVLERIMKGTDLFTGRRVGSWRTRHERSEKPLQLLTSDL
jgi:hypothetical protein